MSWEARVLLASGLALRTPFLPFMPCANCAGRTVLNTGNRKSKGWNSTHRNYHEELTDAKLVSRPPELKRAFNEKFKPGGEPMKQGGLMFNPHF